MNKHEIAKKGSVLSWEYEVIEYALYTCFVAISSKIIKKFTNNDIIIQ